MTITRAAAATGTSPESDSDRVDDRFEDIVRRLDMQYGPRAFAPGGDPTRALVQTILSQSTTDRNSSRAFQSLLDAFPTWDEVIDAPTAEVADAIRAGGLAHQKAPRIQGALRAMRDLDAPGSDLAAMPVDQAMAWLSNLEGVGPKTAACVLLVRPRQTGDAGRYAHRPGHDPARHCPGPDQHHDQTADPDGPGGTTRANHLRCACGNDRARTDRLPLPSSTMLGMPIAGRVRFLHPTCIGG